MSGPPRVVLGGGVRLAAGVVGVSRGRQLLLHAGGQAVAAADRGDEGAAGEFGEGRVGVGVAHEGGQVGLMRYLAAERDGEPQGGAGRFAEPGREQGRGRGAVGERGQRHVVAVLGVEGRVYGRGARASEVAELVEGVRVGAQLVALAQERAGLHEAQREPLRLEPEVAGPVRLLVREDAADGPLQEFEAAAAAEAAEEDLFEVRVGGRRGDIGCGRDQEGALGRRFEELVERGAAELEVVEDDDGTDVVDEFEEQGTVGAVQRRVVHGREEVVQQVVRRAAVSGEPDDAVGRDVRAVLGDGVEQRGAPGARGSGEPHGAPAREKPDESFVLLLALGERQPGQRGSGRQRRTGGAGHLGAFRRCVLDGPPRPLPRRAGLDLAAVDGVDGEQEVAGHELHGAGEPL